MSTNPYKAPRPRGRPAGSTAGSSTSKPTKAPAAKAKAPLAKRPAQQRAAAAQYHESDTDPFADSQQETSKDVMEVVDDDEEDDDEEEEEDPPKTIPPELLTRILHTCFEKEGTRISKDANKAVAQYMDIFVRESIARVALEKEAGFLEVCCVGGCLLFFFPLSSPFLSCLSSPVSSEIYAHLPI